MEQDNGAESLIPQTLQDEGGRQRLQVQGKVLVVGGVLLFLICIALLLMHFGGMNGAAELTEDEKREILAELANSSEMSLTEDEKRQVLTELKNSSEVSLTADERHNMIADLVDKSGSQITP